MQSQTAASLDTIEQTIYRIEAARSARQTWNAEEQAWFASTGNPIPDEAECVARMAGAVEMLKRLPGIPRVRQLLRRAKAGLVNDADAPVVSHSTPNTVASGSGRDLSR